MQGIISVFFFATIYIGCFIAVPALYLFRRKSKIKALIALSINIYFIWSLYAFFVDVPVGEPGVGIAGVLILTPIFMLTFSFLAGPISRLVSFALNKLL